VYDAVTFAAEIPSMTTLSSVMLFMCDESYPSSVTRGVFEPPLNPWKFWILMLVYCGMKAPVAVEYLGVKRIGLDRFRTPDVAVAHVVDQPAPAGVRLDANSVRAAAAGAHIQAVDGQM